MRAPESVRRITLEVGYRLGGWPRRVAALVCLVLAVSTASYGRTHATGARAPVVVATRDLAAGTVLRAADVHVAQWDPVQIPERAIRSLVPTIGMSVAAGVDRGEPITAARIRGPGITAGLARGLVAATVSIAKASTLALIRPGDRVDLLATTPADGSQIRPARVVASDVLVLAVLASRSPVNDDESSGLVVAVDLATSRDVASAVDGSITATLRMPP